MIPYTDVEKETVQRFENVARKGLFGWGGQKNVFCIEEIETKG